VAADDAAAYWIRDHRSKETAGDVLGEYAGVLKSDGYAVYQSLAPGSPEITPVHCWAHVRRKFIEAESSYTEECRTAIELIGELYGALSLAIQLVTKVLPLLVQVVVAHAPRIERTA